MADDRRTGLVRGLVEFALNRDIEEEIDAQYRTLQVDPSSSAARLNLGILFYSQGRVEDAICELLMAIECDPSQGRAYRKLGEIYIGLGDYSQAEAYARMAAERGDPKLLEAFKRYPQVQNNLEDESTLQVKAELNHQVDHEVDTLVSSKNVAKS